MRELRAGVQRHFETGVGLADGQFKFVMGFPFACRATFQLFYIGSQSKVPVIESASRRPPEGWQCPTVRREGLYKLANLRQYHD
jgi:hypothetical protein